MQRSDDPEQRERAAVRGAPPPVLTTLINPGTGQLLFVPTRHRVLLPNPATVLHVRTATPPSNSTESGEMPFLRNRQGEPKLTFLNEQWRTRTICE